MFDLKMNKFYRESASCQTQYIPVCDAIFYCYFAPLFVIIRTNANSNTRSEYLPWTKLIYFTNCYDQNRFIINYNEFRKIGI